MVPDDIMDAAWAAYCKETSSPTAAVRAAIEAVWPGLAKRDPGQMVCDDRAVRTDGQLAYETYTCHVGGELAPWDQLTVTVKAGWETAAEAVIQARYAEEDEPSRAERWGITDEDFAEAGLDGGYLLEEDQPWRSGGVRPGE